MGAVWLRARAEMRERWRALVSGALLCGLFGAATLATLAGAARTQSAYPRFLERQRAYDLLISDSSFFAKVFWKPDFKAIAQLPYVETAVPIVAGYMTPAPGSELPEGTGFVGSKDPAFGRTINRPVMVRGRLPDPANPNEIAIPYFAEARTESNERALGSFRTGDRMKIVLQGKTLTLTVVGETALPGELPPQPQFGWQFLVSPAFLDKYATGCVPFQTRPRCSVDFNLDSLLVRFKHRSDIALFDRDVKKMTGGKVLAPQEQATHARAVEGSTDLQASALRLLGLFVALTGAMILGQLLARETTLGSSEAATLRALGFDRSQLFRLGLLRVVPVAVGGAAIAVGGAWLASSLFPRGSVRVVERTGLMLQGRILGLGALVILAVVLAVVVWPAWRVALSIGRTSTPPGRPSAVASALTSLGMSVPAVAGARLALERGRGKTAVPVISSLTVVSIGVASFVAALTFAGSLHQVIDRPALYGKTWDGVVTTQSDADFFAEEKQKALSERAGNALAADPGVEAAAFVDSGAPLIVFGAHGPPRGISVLGLTIRNLKGSLYCPIVEGRAPRTPNEAVLGARMIRALGLHLDPKNPPAIQVGLQGAGDRRATLRVVGRAIIPPLGNFGELGFGIMLASDEGLSAALADPSQIPPTTDLIVRWRPGTDPSTVIARVAKKFPVVRPGDPVSLGKFSDAVSFGGVQGAPLAVGGMLAGLSAAALAHVLVTAIRRRRRDIAILKTIGLVRGQARRAVAWQATVTVLVAAIVGIPLGVMGGRWLWVRVAENLGVLTRPTVSVTALAILPVALVLLANLIAALPARSAARMQPAAVLRTE